MITIPVSLTEKQFDEHIRPYISTAKRGFESRIRLFKVFNYILYRLHSGCQWYQLPIVAEPGTPDKKRSVMMPFTTIFVNGAEMVIYEAFGNTAL